MNFGKEKATGKRWLLDIGLDSLGYFPRRQPVSSFERGFEVLNLVASVDNIEMMVINVDLNDS